MLLQIQNNWIGKKNLGFYVYLKSSSKGITYKLFVKDLRHIASIKNLKILKENIQNGEAAELMADTCINPLNGKDIEIYATTLPCTTDIQIDVVPGYTPITNFVGEDAAKILVSKDIAFEEVLSYSIRDWLVSRQRFWGTPIPIIYCDNCGIVPVPEEDLPVTLPEDCFVPLEKNINWKMVACPKCKCANAVR